MSWYHSLYKPINWACANYSLTSAIHAPMIQIKLQSILNLTINNQNTYHLNEIALHWLRCVNTLHWIVCIFGTSYDSIIYIQCVTQVKVVLNDKLSSTIHLWYLHIVTCYYTNYICRAFNINNKFKNKIKNSTNINI